jgi:hypothetical protein
MPSTISKKRKETTESYGRAVKKQIGAYTCVSLSYVINTSGLRPGVDNPNALMKLDIAPALHQPDKLGFPYCHMWEWT